jgi:hypothetical protein
MRGAMEVAAYVCYTVRRRICPNVEGHPSKHMAVLSLAAPAGLLY